MIDDLVFLPQPEALAVFSALIPIVGGLVRLLERLLRLLRLCESPPRRSIFAKVLDHEMCQPERVFGGLLGVAASIAVLLPFYDLQAEPIICSALAFGVLSGNSKRRTNWMLAGALFGFAVTVDWGLDIESVLVKQPDRWWLAASFPPLGWLVAGYIRDEQKRAAERAVEAAKIADAEAKAAKAAKIADARAKDAVKAADARAREGAS